MGRTGSGLPLPCSQTKGTEGQQALSRGGAGGPLPLPPQLSFSDCPGSSRACGRWREHARVFCGCQKSRTWRGPDHDYSWGQSVWPEDGDLGSSHRAPGWAERPGFRLDQGSQGPTSPEPQGGPFPLRTCFGARTWNLHPPPSPRAVSRAVQRSCQFKAESQQSGLGAGLAELGRRAALSPNDFPRICQSFLHSANICWAPLCPGWELGAGNWEQLQQ